MQRCLFCCQEMRTKTIFYCLTYKIVIIGDQSAPIVPLRYFSVIKSNYLSFLVLMVHCPGRKSCRHSDAQVSICSNKKSDKIGSSNSTLFCGVPLSFILI